MAFYEMEVATSKHRDTSTSGISTVRVMFGAKPVEPYIMSQEDPLCYSAAFALQLVDHRYIATVVYSRHTSRSLTSGLANKDATEQRVLDLGETDART